MEKRRVANKMRTGRGKVSKTFRIECHKSTDYNIISRCLASMQFNTVKSIA